jgi:hypothetical protein
LDMQPPDMSSWVLGAAYAANPAGFTALNTKSFQSAVIEGLNLVVQNQRELAGYLVRQHGRSLRQSKTINAKMAKALLRPFEITMSISEELRTELKGVVTALYDTAFESLSGHSPNDRANINRVWDATRPDPVDPHQWPVIVSLSSPNPW